MEGAQRPVVLVRTRALACALPAAAVVETMRPLPVQPLAGQPAFVRGIAVIRGAPTPVVDLAALVSGGDAAPAARFVTVRVGDRRVALAVETVLGLTRLAPSVEAGLGPLLGYVSEAAVTALGALDSSLLVVLDTTRVVPEEVWRACERAGP